MDSSKWIKDVVKAHDFKFGAAAIRFAFEQRLENFEIIYAFEKPEHNISSGTLSPTPCSGH